MQKQVVLLGHPHGARVQGLGRACQGVDVVATRRRNSKHVGACTTAALEGLEALLFVVAAAARQLAMRVLWGGAGADRDALRRGHVIAAGPPYEMLEVEQLVEFLDG